MDKGQPEKYIRTFAGDMETLQKDGTPDLMPLTPRSEPKEPLVPPPPVAPPLRHTEASREGEPLTPTPPAYTPPLPANAPLKTYAGDFRDRVKETHASTATVLAAEQDHAPPLLKAPATPSRKNLLYSIIGAVLLVAGVAGVSVAYMRYKAATAPVVVTEAAPAPIVVDEREEVSGTGRILIEAIKKSADRPIAVGAVRLLSIVSTTGSEAVFSALSVGAPDVLLRNIQARGSMAGVVQVSGIQSPFFILSVSSYSNTFSGMLSWEREMLTDLAPLFPARPAPVSATPMATSTTATTTQSGTPKTATTTTPPSPKDTESAATTMTFVDASIASHDARVYRDAGGRDVLVYGYWNQATLIIARDAAAFAELVDRLATSRVQ